MHERAGGGRSKVQGCGVGSLAPYKGPTLGDTDEVALTVTWPTAHTPALPTISNVNED